MFEQMPPQFVNRFWRVGYAADPAIDVLLDKSKLAQIRIAMLDQVITQLQQQIDLAKMEQGLLKEQYQR